MTNSDKKTVSNSIDELFNKTREAVSLYIIKRPSWTLFTTEDSVDLLISKFFDQDYLGRLSHISDIPADLMFLEKQIKDDIAELNLIIKSLKENV
jgi:hypothetical protein